MTLISCSNVVEPSHAPSFDICPCSATVCQAIPAQQRFGFYDDHLINSYQSTLANHATLFGAYPAYLLWFIQIDDPFPGTLIRINNALNIKTVLSINIKSISMSQSRNDTLLTEIIDGLWDSTFIIFADSIRNFGDTVYYRFGYEMNGDWFPWGGRPNQFVSAWRHIHDIFSAQHADNALWIFSPNVLWDDKTFAADILPYYPGDEYVDIVGLDGYNFGDEYDQWHSWQTFGEVFSVSLEECRSFHKSLWITETACPVDPRRVQWLSDCFSYLDRNPCIEAFIWFSAAKANKPDFRLDSDSASLQILKQLLAP